MQGFGDNKKSKKRKLNAFQIKQYHNQLMYEAFKFHSEGNITEAMKSYQYLIKNGFKDEAGNIIKKSKGIVMIRGWPGQSTR